MPTPPVISTPNDSYFTLVPSFSEALPTHHYKPHRQFAQNDKEEYPNMPPRTDTTTEAVTRKVVEPSNSSESIINIYLPQLSPEISFCDNGSTLDIPDDKEESKEEGICIDSSERPCIRKRVSFSDQLLTYIPDEDVSSVSNSTDSSSISSCPLDQQLSKQADNQTQSNTVNNQPPEEKTILATEKKVNTMPIQHKFVPAAAIAVPVQRQEDASLRKPGAASNSPQRLSNKLLDIFQQKLTHHDIKTPTPSPQQMQSLKTPNRELVHVTYFILLFLLKH
jgi:hypothetical protein